MKKAGQVRVMLTPDTLEKVVCITGRGRKYKSMEDLALAAVRRSLGHRPLAAVHGQSEDGTQSSDSGQGASYDLPLFKILRARLAHEISTASAALANGQLPVRQEGTERISPRFPDDDREFMEKVSTALGLPMSKIVEVSIESLLDEEAANKP